MQQNNETWVTCISWRSSFGLWSWNSVCYWAVIFVCYVCPYHGHPLSILIQDKDPDNHLKLERGKFHSVGPKQHPLYSSSLLLSQTWAHQCDWCIDLPLVAGNRGQHDDLQNYNNMLQEKFNYFITILIGISSVLVTSILPLIYYIFIFYKLANFWSFNLNFYIIFLIKMHAFQGCKSFLFHIY